MTPYFAKVASGRPSVARARAFPSVGQVVDARTNVAPAPVPLPPAVAPIQAPASAPAKKTHLVEHPLAQHALTTLRAKETPSLQFRQASCQLLGHLMIEATRALPVRDRSVETAAGKANGLALSKPVVFISVGRHGLGLAHQLTEWFPQLVIGMVSLDRSDEGKSVQPRLHIANAPALGDAVVFLFDPVVASGGSAQSALNLLRRSGVTNISLVSFLVSLPGLSRLQSSHPDLQVWTAGIDAELDAKRGPLPGLGNFAERQFG